MNVPSIKVSRLFAIVCGIAVLAVASWAHVTFKPNQPFEAGGPADITMVVPTERSVATVRVTLELPEAFLKAGGRLSRIDFPAGWQVKIDREDKPGDIFAREMDVRTKRSGDTEHVAAAPAKTPGEKKEEQLENDMRRKWIKRVTFTGGSIPPDGFKAFSLQFQLPTEPGVYRLPAVQTYADGVEVSWSELVEGAPHPAPSIVIQPKNKK